MKTSKSEFGLITVWIGNSEWKEIERNENIF
jgi:hypothetical protein